MPQQSALFGVARVRVHEKKLLNKERLARMAEASAQEALRLLLDSGYGTMPEATIEDSEEVIASALLQTYTLIREVTPNPLLTDIFLMKADIHNLKLLLKLRLTGSTEEPAFMSGGIYDTEKLSHMVASSDYSALPDLLRLAMESLELSFVSHINPVKISVQLDNAYMEYALNNGNDFVVEYFKAQADFNNVLGTLRLRAMNQGADKLKEVYIPGGDITFQTLSCAMEIPIEAFAKAVATGPASRSIQQGLDAMLRTGRISSLERERDNYLITLAGRNKGEIDTIAPIIGFLLAREQEAKCIRLILTAKRNDLPDSIISERLRELYG